MSHKKLVKHTQNIHKIQIIIFQYLATDIPKITTEVREIVDELSTALNADKLLPSYQVGIYVHLFTYSNWGLV
jgi:hypothetical protein